MPQTSEEQQIQAYRLKIDELHDELFQLFLTRAELSQKIWDLKEKKSLNYVDQDREKMLVHRYDHHIALQNDPELKEFYHDFIRHLIYQNKHYLKKYLDKKGHHEQK